jgi:hypothetical protein
MLAIRALQFHSLRVSSRWICVPKTYSHNVHVEPFNSYDEKKLCHFRSRCLNGDFHRSEITQNFDYKSYSEAILPLFRKNLDPSVVTYLLLAIQRDGVQPSFLLQKRVLGVSQLNVEGLNRFLQFSMNCLLGRD